MLHPNDASGLATKDFLISKWKEWGGKIVAVETTDLGASDFHVQLAKIRVSKPDVIFNYFYSMDLGYSLKQARELGIDLEMYGLQWNKKLFKASGPACKGFYYVMDYFDPASQKPWTQKFVAAYKKRSAKGADPEMYAANAYELIYILKELIIEARKKGGNYYTGENLKDALLKIRSFDTIYEDKITFLDDGTCTKSMMLWTALENGDAKMVRKLSLK